MSFKIYSPLSPLWIFSIEFNGDKSSAMKSALVICVADLMWKGDKCLLWEHFFKQVHTDICVADLQQRASAGSLPCLNTP